MQEDSARLEEQLIAVARQQAEDHSDIRVIRDAVHRIEIKLETFTGQLCEAPGECLILRPKVAQLEDQVGDLRTYVEQVKGAGTMIHLLWVLVLAAASLVAYLTGTGFFHVIKP